MCCCSWGSVSMPWKRNRVLRVATKRGTHYLLWQPWLPLWQAILVRGAFGVCAPARPATLFRAFCFCLLFPTSSLTVILRFVSTNLRDVALRPAPVLAAVHVKAFPRARSEEWGRWMQEIVRFGQRRNTPRPEVQLPERQPHFRHTVRGRVLIGR